MTKMANENSPAETDMDSIECFQNYSASEVFVQGLAGLVDQRDVESMISKQKQMLQRFEKTNEMLSNCNILSTTRLKVAGQQFKNYKQLLTSIKKDLDYSFKKINAIKSKLQNNYPDSFAAVQVAKAKETSPPDNADNSSDDSNATDSHQDISFSTSDT